MAASGKFRFCIDRGGTFTDVYAQCPGGKVRVLKLLSEDPSSYPDAPREAIRRILEQELGAPMPASEPLSCSAIQWIRMGTTVATNALLERKGERTALAITRGFRDLLYIGNQSRPDLFDLTVSMPETLYESVVEVKERVVLCQGDCQLGLSHPVVVGSTGEELYEVEPVDVASLRQDLAAVLALGIRSLAVVLLHSYTFPAHEQVVGEVAREMGFTHVSLSSQVMPMVRAVPRGFTVCADAYLTPCIKKYVAGFTSGFKDKEHLKVLFMQSDGGLTPMNRFVGSRAILSGPAGGVVGYAVTAYHHQLCGGCQRLPVIGFDMGGTSTDVSRYTGEYEHIFESTVAGVVIQSPQLDISTVAAGGGSMLCFRAGLFVVGPESAGANPGPACYSKGGPLTVTDANLCLGRLLPSYFPKIFGPNEDQPLNEPAMLLGFQRLTDKVNEALGGEGLSVQEVALGYVRVAVESMCKPIRAITQGKGHDTSSHVLACFGGAGGQHACAVAKALGISTVYIHRYSGILSAYGLALADVVHEAQEPCAVHYEDSTFQYLDERLDVLSRECVDELEKQGFKRDEITTQPYLHLRYDKTDCPIMCAPLKATENSCRHGDFKASFTQHYHCEFGFTIPNRAIVVDDVRVRGLGRGLSFQPHPLQEANAPPVVDTVTQCYFEGGYVETSVYLQEQLCYGHRMEGPCILIDTNSTILVEPGCVASISKHGDVLIEVGSESIPCVGTGLDAIHLSIFSHRFMSIAEQMGRVLQRTSISTNIKERLDFSCALFGPTGGLVANAPHIPVHLGAMQEAVKFQIQYLGGDVREGDVILSNHPSAGGSHLPDLTVITPVFYPEQEKPVFFVANRGHHAEIGGISPGSMPPFSKYLWQEGMCVKSFKLVQNGVFQEEGLVRLLESPGTQPGSSGSRNIRDNISDLRAQVAANQKGIHLVRELIDVYSLPVVQAYMAYIQENAEGAVRDMLKEVSQSMQGPSLSALEHLDDGTAIQLSISITSQGEATFDFSGTGRLVAGNLNAPRAVTLSAILYCLRCMVAHDVPLNQGCLKPVKVVIPEGSVLDPREDSAVVGGNVLTCQRLVDVVFKAFAVCAASQGCMNNTVFGDESMGYYETVAGGAGAGPGWHGRSGVHTHMTNTRITDPEILERRYPVVLKQFHLNRGTGGLGLYCGGDGVLREMLFRRPLTLSVLTERRGPYKPYGLEGGGDGSTGRNTLVRASGQEQDLSGKACVGVEPGDTFRLESPAGGGYGDPSAVLPAVSKPPNTAAPLKGGGSLYTYKLNQESA